MYGIWNAATLSADTIFRHSARTLLDTNTSLSLNLSKLMQTAKVCQPSRLIERSIAGGHPTRRVGVAFR